MNKYYKIKQYEEALYTLTDWFHSYHDANGLVHEKHIDDEYEKAIETLEQLIYQYQMRLSDAELLNKLRAMTNTMGDLDLTSEIQRLIDFERDTLIKESDKVIFTATMVKQ